MDGGKGAIEKSAQGFFSEKNTGRRSEHRQLNRFGPSCSEKIEIKEKP